jgi:cellulose synthase/poly-beta-1,6-N-acetylglucosamine synthase-like glycosyltransferase
MSVPQACSTRPEVPFCSVVVPTRYRPRELERCLGAIADLDYPLFETIVVDNSSGDPAALDLARRAGARYLIEERRGVSCARNAGALAARGEIVAYVDDDAVPEHDWLAALVRQFDDPEVVAVAGPYLPLDGDSCARGFFGGFERRVIDRSVPRWFEVAAFGGFARAGNMAVRATAFKEWSGFEPRLGRGTALRAAEDDYAVLELVELGHRVVYTPDAIVRHLFPREGLETREYHRKFITEKGLFVGFLLTANKRYRVDILRYLAARLRGKRLHYNQQAPLSISRSLEIAAGLKGLVLFASLQLGGKISRQRNAALSR